jgi:hypothetical protein
MSTDMTLRFVIIGVIAQFLVLAFAMDQDSYTRGRSKEQPASIPSHSE